MPPAHPRSRGEHSGGMSEVSVWDGSSPLARGTPHGLEKPLGVFRLIPARAGNTFNEVVEAHNTAAHPRSRGEHLLNLIAHVFSSGSSPLARGTQATRC